MLETKITTSKQMINVSINLNLPNNKIEHGKVEVYKAQCYLLYCNE